MPPLLPNLPVEVKRLVNDGIYSVYEVRELAAPYVLMTNRVEFYALSAEGTALPDVKISALTEKDIVSVIHFDELPRPPVLKPQC